MQPRRHRLPGQCPAVKPPGPSRQIKSALKFTYQQVLDLSLWFSVRVSVASHADPGLFQEARTTEPEGSRLRTTSGRTVCRKTSPGSDPKSADPPAATGAILPKQADKNL